MKLLASIILLASPLAHSATIPERLYDIDYEFYQMVNKTNICVLSMNDSNRKPGSLDNCRDALSIEKKDIKRLKNKFIKQTNRYKERKHKLTEHSRYWSKEYIFKIKERVKDLKTNTRLIYKRNKTSG